MSAHNVHAEMAKAAFPASSATVTVMVQVDGLAMDAYGTSVPSGVAGYHKGCIFRDTSTGICYSNTGTSSSCTFTTFTT